MPTPTDGNYPHSAPKSSALKEEGIEYGFIGKLQELKYDYRPDIRDRAALEKNFREKFEALNRCRLTDSEFARLLDEIVSPDASFDSTEIQVCDVLLNITGASIGRSAVADERVAGGNVNQHVCIIRTKPSELNPLFLNQYLISQRGQKQIDSFQAGGNRQGLNFAQIRSFSIPLPPTLGEQQLIADHLSSLDTLITAATQKLETLKLHKRGLMQQLFPSPEEMQA